MRYVGQHVKGRNTAYLHRSSVRSPIIAQQRRSNARKDWPEAMGD